jgi:hypothetical protein
MSERERSHEGLSSAPAHTTRVGRRAFAVGLLATLAGCGGDRTAEAGPGTTTFPSLTTFADYERALEELSNWGRWGEDDELGAANFITPEKRVAAARLVTEGITVSLAHDIIQEPAIDGNVVLDRQVVAVSATGASDRYQYTGTYHGTVHSHLDALDCHIMVDGRGYNGVSMEEIQAAGGCPRGSIHALREGILTRGGPVRCYAPAGLRDAGGVGRARQGRSTRPIWCGSRRSRACGSSRAT